MEAQERAAARKWRKLARPRLKSPVREVRQSPRPRLHKRRPGEGVGSRKSTAKGKSAVAL